VTGPTKERYFNRRLLVHILIEVVVIAAAVITVVVLTA
jgi:hypothetical protein